MKNLFIIDFEATCYERGKEPPNFWSEIIEIGAVLVNTSTLQIESEFQTFVKPVLSPYLSEFCRNLTSIQQRDVDKAPLFKDAIKMMSNKFNKDEVIFASWGNYDRNKLENSCRKFKCNYPFNNEHINLKQTFADFWSEKLGRNIKPMGMDGALNFCNIKLDGTHHRGIDDAKNIAKLAIDMINNGWVVE